jgi:hypothetical protein
MLPRGHRIYATQRLRVSKVIEAPLKYVYDWSTDYRADDWVLSKARPHSRFQVVRVSTRRLLRIRVTPTTAKEPDVAVDSIRLCPPDAWHTDQIDERDLEAVDYQLTALGPARTRIDLLVTERWLTPVHLSRAETRRRVRAAWDRCASHIEARYQSGRPARG